MKGVSTKRIVSSTIGEFNHTDETGNYSVKYYKRYFLAWKIVMVQNFGLWATKQLILLLYIKCDSRKFNFCMFRCNSIKISSKEIKNIRTKLSIRNRFLVLPKKRVRDGVPTAAAASGLPARCDCESPDR